MSLRDELLNVEILKIEELFVERLNKTLRLRELNGDGRDRITLLYVRSGIGRDGAISDVPPRVNETYVVLGVVDADGTRVFGDKDVDMIAEKWPGQVVKEIADKVSEISGMSPGAEENAAKNSESDLNSGSGSGSHSTLDTQ